MGVWQAAKEMFVESLRHRSVFSKLSRSDYYKLQMLCEAINKNVDADYEVTPDMIATRVLETFIQESFEDSTNRLVKKILPEARIKRRRKI